VRGSDVPEVRGGGASTDVHEELGRLLTAAEVAERLGYTERYVWKLGREGVLPRIKLPGRKYVRFAESDVERFVASCREQVRAPRPVPARFDPPPPAFPRRF
jgi:excisionase family DNA binding protein